MLDGRDGGRLAELIRSSLGRSDPGFPRLTKAHEQFSGPGLGIETATRVLQTGPAQDLGNAADRGRQDGGSRIERLEEYVRNPFPPGGDHQDVEGTDDVSPVWVLTDPNGALI